MMEERYKLNTPASLLGKRASNLLKFRLGLKEIIMDGVCYWENFQFIGCLIRLRNHARMASLFDNEHGNRLDFY